MQCPLYSASQKYKNNPAILSGSEIITYEELNNLVNACVQRLQKLNIKPGQRVAILSVNSTAYIILLFALWRIKAITCLLSPRLPTHAVARQLKFLESNILFTSLKNLIQSKVVRSRKYLMSEFTQGSNANISKASTIELNQPLTIMYTSGTSDTPKAALHTFGNFYYNAAGANKNITIKPDDGWLLSLPLYHVGGLGIVFRSFLKGGSIIVPTEKEKPSSCIKKYPITHMSLVPTQFCRLLQEPSNLVYFKKMKAILIGGSPIPSSLLKQSQKHRLPLFLTYGLTEMSSQVATSSTPYAKPKILKHRQVKISAENEILVKGKALFRGYLLRCPFGDRSADPRRCVGDPKTEMLCPSDHGASQKKKIVLPLNKNGWFKTGDLGRLIKNKYLLVNGRKDNMFISGGENIQPEEIEKYLCQLDGIEEVVVIPQKDAEFGMRPVVFIRGNIKNTKQLNRHLLKYLPKFKIPDNYFAWPKNKISTPKPNRNSFRKLVEHNIQKLKILTRILH